MTDTSIFLSRLHFPVHTLGPGCRIGIWFQGCSIRCVGCVSMDTWVKGRGATTVRAVLKAIEPWLVEADGITVSGGEPFDQSHALLSLLSNLRTRTQADVLVYSGYALERLELAPFSGLIDVLITDPFELSSPQTLALRGSDNQRLVCLTALGKARFGEFERLSNEGDRALDIMFDDRTGEIFLAGVPHRGDVQRLAELLQTEGHKVTTSEDTRHGP